MNVPNLSTLPFWNPLLAVVGHGKESPRPAQRPTDATREVNEGLTPSEHEWIFRSIMPALPARPTAGKEYRGRCPIHGTSDSGLNFSVDFETGKCRCLSRGCVQGYVHELVAAMNGLSLPKDLPKVRAIERRILGKPEPQKNISKALPSTHTVAPVAVGSDGSAWKAMLIRNASNTPRPIIANANEAFRNADGLKGLVGWDDFGLKTVLKGDPPWTGRLKPGDPWTEQYDVLAAEHLQRQGLMVGTALVMEAVQTVAQENVFHPVRDYLESLRWDGDRRLGTMGPIYMGAEPSEFTAQVVMKWLIGAVARIYQPGAKVDTMLILEGAQGVGKSSFFRVLGGEWFTDDLGDIRTKEAAERIQGKWIVEVAELDSLNRAEESLIKAFLSRTSDRFRPAYGRRAIDAPRQCIFAGTTNGEAYLKDGTGGRRFWPVRVNRIDVNQLSADRDQLWAEAVVEYRDGQAWWLSEALENEAREIQADRRQEDPWLGTIATWLEGKDEEPITTARVLTSCFDKHKSAWLKNDEMRVGGCLRLLGFERVKRRIGGRSEWCFIKSNKLIVPTVPALVPASGFVFSLLFCVLSHRSYLLSYI